MIICCPVGAYYATGLDPVKILVEDELVRAVKGGTGFTKCGGNYAGSILGQVKAEKMGYAQVLWLDGEHRKYVEEVGTMNIMFKIAGEIYTAPIEGTVLPGVTRDSMIHLLRDWGYKVNETRLSVDDLMKAGHDGTLEEVFGTGTAAVISPVGELRYKDDVGCHQRCQDRRINTEIIRYFDRHPVGQDRRSLRMDTGCRIRSQNRINEGARSDRI